MRPSTLIARIHRDLDALEEAIATAPKRKRSGARARPVLRESAFTPLPVAPEPAAVDDTLLIGKERGALRHFIFEKGKTWKFPGPNPFEEGCRIRPSVMAEYKDQLEALAYQLANPEPNPEGF